MGETGGERMDERCGLSNVTVRVQVAVEGGRLDHDLFDLGTAHASRDKGRQNRNDVEVFLKLHRVTDG